MYSISLDDGTKITGLKDWGSYFQSDSLTPDDLLGRLSDVSIEGQPDDPDAPSFIQTGHFHNLKLWDPHFDEGVFRFALQPMSNLEVLEAKLQSQIDYIAMMDSINL